MDGWYPVTVTLDGKPTPIEVKAFTVGEAIAYDRAYTRLAQINNRHVFDLQRWEKKLDAVDADRIPPLPPEPKPDGADDSPAVKAWLATQTTAVLRRARWVENRKAKVAAFRDMDSTAAERARQRELEEEDDKFATDFVINTVSNYVRLPGDPPTPGFDVLRRYGSRLQELYALLGTVKDENNLTEEEKKASRSGSDSGTSSSTSTPPPSGDKPAPTAASAPLASSAGLEAATAPRNGALSGPPSAPVPFETSRRTRPAPSSGSTLPTATATAVGD